MLTGVPALLSTLFLIAVTGFAQDTDVQPQPPPPVPDKRAYIMLPNYRTVEPGTPIEPLTYKGKFTIASKDTFDAPIFVMSGILSGISHLQNQNPSFGQGITGYAHRYVTGFADQAMGNLFAEATLPSILHQDPRYFRRGTGSNLSRATYAFTRVIITRTDRGHKTFNISEIGGNAAVAGIGNLYYPDSRGWGDNLSRLISFTTTDAIGNVLKEFWPDIKRRLQKRGSSY